MKRKKLVRFSVRFFVRFPQEKYAILVLGKMGKMRIYLPFHIDVFRPLSHRTISPFIIGVAGGENIVQIPLRVG
jgi:hypothetical protein